MVSRWVQTVRGLAWCAGLAMLAGGCDVPSAGGSWPGAIRAGVDPVARLDPSAVRVAEAPQREVTEQLAQLANEIASRHEDVFRAAPPNDVIHEVELVFLQTGRIAELAGYYREAVERQGEGAPMRPRLAMMYQRLGQPELAEQQARRAVQERPEDPAAHFSLAFCLGQVSAQDSAVLPEVRDGLARALALDPGFSLGSSMTNAQIRMELARLEELLGARVNDERAGGAVDVRVDGGEEQ